jgi:hypothetical protein
MHRSDVIAAALTTLFVVALVLYRLAWAGSQLAATAGLGRLPKLSKRWRRWLFGEHGETSPERRV